MGNEYRRFLKNQFGKKNYAEFVRSVKSGINSSTIIDKDVYHEIYQSLKALQPGTLIGKHRQLEEVITRVMYIGKTYFCAVAVYFFAVAVLLFYGTVPLFTYAGLLLLTIVFAMKTGEYLGNKFCYVDVRIIINYKTALERLLLEAEVQKKETNTKSTRI